MRIAHLRKLRLQCFLKGLAPRQKGSPRRCEIGDLEIPISKPRPSCRRWITAGTSRGEVSALVPLPCDSWRASGSAPWSDFKSLPDVDQTAQSSRCWRRCGERNIGEASSSKKTISFQPRVKVDKSRTKVLEKKEWILSMVVNVNIFSWKGEWDELIEKGKFDLWREEKLSEFGSIVYRQPLHANLAVEYLNTILSNEIYLNRLIKRNVFSNEYKNYLDGDLSLEDWEIKGMMKTIEPDLREIFAFFKFFCYKYDILYNSIIYEILLGVLLKCVSGELEPDFEGIKAYILSGYDLPPEHFFVFDLGDDDK